MRSSKSISQCRHEIVLLLALLYAGVAISAEEAAVAALLAYEANKRKPRGESCGNSAHK